jgi:hypothetical protein
MIQFNRYKLQDETHDFHGAFVNLVNALSAEINGDCHRSVGLLMSLAERFPHNDRIPAVAARMYFWGKVSWSTIERMMPAKLPNNFFYKQELVGCLGFEHSARKWDITEDQWRLYQGFTEDNVDVNHRTGKVSYRPRNSGFFSVIENIIAAEIVAEMQGKQMLIDLSGNWWGYDEPFEDIFCDTFEFTKDGELPKIDFDSMRRLWLNADDRLAACLGDHKQRWYTAIVEDIACIASPITNMDSAGVMFVRGGDKLQTETILPPMGFLLRDLKWMARRCDERYVISDDQRVGEAVSALDAFVVDKSNKVEGGYHHHYGSKISCMNILTNYMSMVEAKENMSCPSANLVNAAQWSRIDRENYSFANPVYRYLLI